MDRAENSLETIAKHSMESLPASSFVARPLKHPDKTAPDSDSVDSPEHKTRSDDNSPRNSAFGTDMALNTTESDQAPVPRPESRSILKNRFSADGDSLSDGKAIVSTRPKSVTLNQGVSIRIFDPDGRQGAVSGSGHSSLKDVQPTTTGKIRRKPSTGHLMSGGSINSNIERSLTESRVSKSVAQLPPDRRPTLTRTATTAQEHDDFERQITRFYSSNDLPDMKSTLSVAGGLPAAASNPNESARKHPTFRPMKTIMRSKDAPYIDSFHRRQSMSPVPPKQEVKVAVGSWRAWLIRILGIRPDDPLDSLLEDEYAESIRPAFIKYWRITGRLVANGVLTLGVLAGIMFFGLVKSSGIPSRPYGYQFYGTLTVFASMALLNFATELYALREPHQHPNKALKLRFYAGSILMSLLTLFQEYRGPSPHVAISLTFLYTYPALGPYLALKCGSIITIMDFVLSIVRMSYQAGPAPNLASNCIDFQDPTSSPGCAAQFVSILLLHIGFNVIGAIYCFTMHRHGIRLFLKNKDLQSEIQKYDETAEEVSRVALSLLPEKVWDELRGNRKGPYAIASVFKKGKLTYRYDNVTILFGDVVGFTQLASMMGASKLVRLLDAIFTEFDDLVELYGLEKIKTIGDCYMVCAGIPNHVAHGELRMLAMAKHMIAVLERANERNGLRLQMRIGLHRGSAWGGILGTEKLIYDVWSRDVTIASLMEHTGKPSKIHVSEAIMQVTQSKCKFVEGDTVQHEGEQIKTYFLQDMQIPRNFSELEASSKSLIQVEPPLYSSLVKSGTSSIMKDVEVPESRRKATNTTREISNELMNPWTNRFCDENLEEDYQRRCVEKESRHLVWSLKTLLTVCTLIWLINVILPPPGSVLGIGGFFSIAAIALALFMIRGSGSQAKQRSSKRLDVENNSPGTTFVHRNIQILAPFFMITVYVGSMTKLITTFQTAMLFQYGIVSLIFFIAAIFPRARYLNLAMASFLIMIIHNSFQIFAPNPEFSFSVQTYGVFSSLSMISVFGLITFVSFMVERQLRKDFLNGKDLLRQRFMTEDIRIRMAELLDKLVPLDVVERLRENPKCVVADFIEEAAILFAEIDVTCDGGVNESSSSLMDKEIVVCMNEIYSGFDRILMFHHVEKIKSIGHVYIAMAYGDTFDEEEFETSETSSEYISTRAEYFNRLGNYALTMQRVVDNISEQKKSQGIKISLRIGMQVGALVAGVIGKKKLTYDVWGDTVNVASRMQSLAPPGTIQVTEACAALLEKKYKLEERGIVSVKGKGEMRTFFLKDRLNIE